ncbi:amidohydrolase family protein [Bariatricus massiliensis]|uniref:Adenine deaminase n=1 Tax=Bariatricus massiliensis TaxID=1745713 RepID=A0ABS8DDC3_9FIRM|nr:adenine deaminase C-terminal domain-containing protein [Bariatricus massiliensis]MCB7303738.1 amidohydrolase family protein [Bariatricus massiliensis]MCB7373154.1 amidohydrolase family protein [Bariatricus massiliensis]MCB7385824.1 amidohydrolase family protein [Bariatricus massiliensis]MCB7409986.1 amidohydrolase family protein [Bariatricus massiliensis]MCQ5253046.1 amidohydrolase family protein [Bariatricus massiliensis]
MEKVDLLIKDTEIFNAYLKKFLPADVYILEDKIYFVHMESIAGENCGQETLEAERVIDGRGYRMIPGFIDIHMHIESSMMTPVSFGERAAQCGVTTLVSEPHEIANVMGIQGVHEMINGAKDSPIDIFYGIPSSVPSTNEELETTGGRIGLEEMKRLMEEDGVVCVGEVMNYRKIVQGEELEITRFLDYLQEEKPQAVVEGHCPTLKGLELAKFLYRGIDADHTEHTLQEIKERFASGMFVELQEKMLKPEIIKYIVENRLYEHCCFVTDDTMADELKEKGQLNHIVRKAASLGFPAEEAVYCATYTPAVRMNLKDRGALAPGRKADFQLLKAEEFEQFEPAAVFKDGREVYRKGVCEPRKKLYEFPNEFYHSVKIRQTSLADLEPHIETECGQVMVRVIEVSDGCTQTKEKLVRMEVKDGRLRWEDSGCMLAAVLERHGKNGNIGYGFVTGDCIKRGAAATTYFHDHHNLLVLGENRQDMRIAAERILQMQGGICTVLDGRVSAELPLPVCGILSELPADEIGEKLGQVRKGLEDLGYKHYNPIMSLCTLGLPVSPALKLTDRGLIDVVAGSTVPLIVEEAAG